MRLLDTTTLQLNEFFGTEIPYYVILSHRWGDDEVSFKDLQQGGGPGKEGWGKIIGCCAQARREGWEYAWIDTCCIDKSSSSELSEAINSMFQWYQDAQVCYAYLNDVPTGEEDHDREDSGFRNSEWFMRGWTLQELLAPQTVIFFNSGWIEIGTRNSLHKLIASITRINICFHDRYSTASVAQKLSWASRRQTLREEDMAYCLMGLFGVNMPLLYGEGNAAFSRLQLEIMKISDDDSLFAWIDSTGGFTGLLARSPAAFQESGEVIKSPGSTSPYYMTNKGLSISLMLLSSAEAVAAGIEMPSVLSQERVLDDNYVFAPLGCYISSDDVATESRIVSNRVIRKRIVLCLYRRKIADGGEWYMRSHIGYLCRLLVIQRPDITNYRRKEERIYIRQRQHLRTSAVGLISKIELNAVHTLGNSFTISSFIKDNNNLAQGHISDESSADLPTGDHKLVLSLELAGQRAFIEFKCPNGPFQLQKTFVLEIYSIAAAYTTRREHVGIVLSLPNGKSLREISREPRSSLTYTLRDRAKITLPTGQLISAALRKQMRDGERVYVVDFHIKP